MKHTLDPAARLLVVSPGPLEGDEDIGGAVATWTADGAIAALACCSSGDADGDRADADPSVIAAARESEQRAAAAILGYRSVTFLHRPAGAVADDLALREQLVRLIREVRPDTLVLPDPTTLIDGHGRLAHADQRACGLAAIGAIDPAARPMAFPGLVRSDGLEPWRVPRLILVRPTVADVGIDVSDALERKITAIRAHASVPDRVAAAVARSSDGREAVRVLTLDAEA